MKNNTAKIVLIVVAALLLPVVLLKIFLNNIGNEYNSDRFFNEEESNSFVQEYVRKEYNLDLESIYNGSEFLPTDHTNFDETEIVTARDQNKILIHYEFYNYENPDLKYKILVVYDRTLKTYEIQKDILRLYYDKVQISSKIPKDMGEVDINLTQQYMFIKTEDKWMDEYKDRDKCMKLYKELQSLLKDSKIIIVLAYQDPYCIYIASDRITHGLRQKDYMDVEYWDNMDDSKMFNQYSGSRSISYAIAVYELMGACDKMEYNGSIIRVGDSYYNNKKKYTKLLEKFEGNYSKYSKGEKFRYLQNIVFDDARIYYDIDDAGVITKQIKAEK